MVESVVAEEKAKEKTIREALEKALASKDDIKKQVTTLSVEIEATRNTLVQAVNDWCEAHLRSLEAVGTTKQEHLLTQRDQLQTKIDSLTSHQKNILGRLNDAKGPEDLVPLCLQMLDKVRKECSYL